MTKILVTLFAGACMAGGVLAHDVDRVHAHPCPPGLVKHHNGCVPPGQARLSHDRNVSLRHQQALQDARVRHDIALRNAEARHQVALQQARARHQAQLQAARRHHQERLALGR